jgi:predicted nucleotidyltransferase
MQWGYVVKRGRLDLVRQRLRRHAIAQDKWKIVRRAAPFLAMVPFVKALAGSGSLALDNTKNSSDLDILVIVDSGRIWTARLFLLCMTQVLGRRRKYYASSAPDMLCLNHYLSSSSLKVSRDIQNICMAMQYAMLVPIFQDGGLRTFLQRNSGWMNSYVYTPESSSVLHRYTILLSSFFAGMKRQAELLLLEPIGDALEGVAERLQQWIMFRHAGRRDASSHAGRIILTANELAFHPDTKVPAIVRAFERI